MLADQTVYFGLLQALICLVDKKTGEKSKTRPRFVKQDQLAIMRLECAGVICMEPFKEFPQLGRFTVRDEGKRTYKWFITSFIAACSHTRTCISNLELV